MVDVNLGARTIENIQQNSKISRNLCRNKVPLFDFIPIKNVAIDLLHLFLYISDVLTSPLIRSIRKADLLDDKTTFKNGVDRTKHKHMANCTKGLFLG